MGDHAECFQVDFDPTVLSFETLLAAFWKAHDPGRPAWSRQYMAAVFYNDETQEKAVRASIPAGPVNTEVLKLDRFTLAEDYHQKYYLQTRSPLLQQLRAGFADFDSFLQSAAACKANALVAGHLRDFDLSLLGLNENLARQVR